MTGCSQMLLCNGMDLSVPEQGDPQACLPWVIQSPIVFIAFGLEILGAPPLDVLSSLLNPWSPKGKPLTPEVLYLSWYPMSPSSSGSGAGLLTLSVSHTAVSCRTGEDVDWVNGLALNIDAADFRTCEGNCFAGLGASMLYSSAIPVDERERGDGL